MNMTPGIRKDLSIGYDEALARVPEALKAEGFGVLTEIDVAATLKAKLGVDFRRYKILGACNPTFAHEALQLDESVALLLPCNVVLADTGHGITISAVDPRELMTGEEFAQLASAAAARLTTAIEDVPSS